MAKQRRRRSPQHQAHVPSLVKFVEPLEERVLLSGNPAAPPEGALVDEGLALLLTVDRRGKNLQLIDQSDNSIVQEQSIKSDALFVIEGTAGADRLTIDFKKSFTYDGEILFEGGDGYDHVILESRRLHDLELAMTGDDGNIFNALFEGNDFKATEIEGFTHDGKAKRISVTGSDQSEQWVFTEEGRHGIQLDQGDDVPTLWFKKPSKWLKINGQGGDDFISVQGINFKRFDLDILGGMGDDEIELLENFFRRADTSIDAGDGDDEVRIRDNEFKRSDMNALGGLGSDLLEIVDNSTRRGRWDIHGGPEDVDDPLDGADEFIITGNDFHRTPVEVWGGAGDDSFQVEDNDGETPDIDAGTGSNTLHGPSEGGTWIVTGEGEVTLNGVKYSGIKNLIGTDDADDVFIIEKNGNIEGVIEGGAGGNDSLELKDHGEGPQTLTHTVTGPQQGTLSNESGSVSHDHSGFESLLIGTEADSHTVELSRDANVTLTQDADGNLVTTIQHAFDALTELDALDGENGFQVSGTVPIGDSGQNVSGVGDVNNDGISDVIIGMPALDEAYVIFGTADGFDPGLNPADLDGSNGFVITGESGSSFGFATAGGGDVNGDGIVDIIVGSPGASSAGAAYVIFGRETAFPTEIDATSLDGTTGFKIEGVAADDAAGFSVAIANDINGDQLADIIVSAPGADPDASLIDAGQVYLIFGRETAFDPILQLTDLDGKTGFALNGVNTGDGIGYAVADVGDLNGDGLSDVGIGAPHAGPNGVDSGAAYVFFGASDLNVAEGLTGGFYESSPVTSLAEAQAVIDGNVPTATFDAYQIDYPNSDDTDTIDGSTLLSDFLGLNAENLSGGNSSTIANSVFSFNGFIHIPEAGEYNFDVGSAEGFRLTIDGQVVTEFDGTRDFATSTGSHTFAEAGFYAISIVYYTGNDPSGIELKSDVNGTMDFISREQLYSAPPVDAIGLDLLNGDNGFVMNGAAAGDLFGADLGNAGDINGDGTTDLIVGSPGSGANGVDSGGAAVLFGKFLTTLDGDRYEAIIEASSLDGTNGITLTGGAAGEMAGTSVGSAGDLNDDGTDDLFVGSPGNANGELAGATYVLFGDTSVGETATTDLGSVDGIIGFKATRNVAGDELGASVAGVGDLNGDGVDDLLIGAGNSVDLADVLFGTAVGGAMTTISYSLPATSFILDGEEVGATITVGMADPEALGATADANIIETDGADVIIKGRTITVEKDVVISTRQIDGSDDYENAESEGDSGDIVLKATADLTDSNAKIDIKEGAEFYAHVDEESEDLAGAVSITATHETPDGIIPIAKLFTEGKRSASVTIDDGVTILGGDVDIATSAGIFDDNVLMQGAGAPGILENLGGAELQKYLQLLDLPVSVQVSIVESTIEIGEEDGTGVRIEGTEGVGIESAATAKASGDAIFWTNPFSPNSAWGFAVGVWYADTTSKVTLHDGVAVRSEEGDVEIAADAITKAGGNARVSQNLDQGLGSKEKGAIPANPNNIALSVGVAVTSTTAKVHVAEGASVIADNGNVAITSNGEDEITIHPETRSYKDGRVGVSIGVQETSNDVQTIINGTVIAGGADVGKQIDFNPFTDINTTNDTIYIGPDHEYANGDEIVYTSELGGPIDGLENLKRYYVINEDTGLIKLAASKHDARKRIAVDLIANPMLTASDGSLSMAMGTVNDIDNLIDFGFAHGFTDGQEVTYTAADGKRIGGLTDGSTYYVVLVDGDDDGTQMQLASDAAGTNLVELSIDLQFMVDTSGEVLTVGSVDTGAGTITFTEEHGLAVGDKILYDPVFGFQLVDDFSEERFENGMEFYVIQAPDESDAGNIDPKTIRLALTFEDAVASNGYTKSVDFDTDESIMTGNVHLLEPKLGSGITASADMTAKYSVESKARIGGKEGIFKQWSRPEFSNGATAFRQAAFESVNNPQLNDVENGNLPDDVNAETGQATLDLSSTLLYQDIDRTVQTVIGSTAELKSQSDIEISAEAVETGNFIVEAGATQSDKNGVKTAIGAAISLATASNTVQAVVNSGAVLDASGDLDVDAELERSFPAEVSSPQAFADGLLEELKADPAEVGELNKALLHPLFTTGWAYSHVAPENADKSVGFAFQYTNFDNSVKAIIADGVLVNQDEEYRSDDQSVTVDADLDMKLVEMAGVYEFGLEATNLAKVFNRTNSPLAEVGVEGENVALGTTFQWTDLDNTVIASVGAASPVNDDGSKNSTPTKSGVATQIHTGNNGKLTVDAHEELWSFSFVDTGAATEGGSFAFAGSGSVLRHNHGDGEVKAMIDAGTTVTGGDVDVDASDTLILIGQNGSIITGNNTRGVGVGVNYWEVHRKVRGFIGDENGDGTSETTFDLNESSTIDVNAESDGIGISLAFASDKRTQKPEEVDSDGEEAPESPDSDEDPLNPLAGVGQGGNPGASGWALAGDASYIDLKTDQVLAFIDTVGEMNADEVSVSATNDNSYYNASGSFAVADTEYASSSNTGLAGSFAGLSLNRGSADSMGRSNSDTLAYIRRTTMDIGAGGLAVEAARKGVYTMAAAGGSGVSRGAGVEVAGSAALNDLDYSTKAFIEEGAEITLAGDSKVKADDQVATIAFAGDGVYKGDIGFGTSWAWNEVDRRVHATITDSTITQDAGTLDLDATLWNVLADENGTALPNSYAVAATLGLGDNTSGELTGTVAVNEFNTNTSANAVETSFTNSTYKQPNGGASEETGLSLSSTDNSNLLAFAGGVDLGADFTLGIASATNELDNQTVAKIENTPVDVNGGDVTVEASVNPEMNAFALGAEVTSQSGAVIFAGSGSANIGKFSADAHILGTPDGNGGTDTSITGAGDLHVDATITYRDIVAGSGQFGVQTVENNGASLGAAIAVNDFTKADAKAYIEEVKVTASGDINVEAETTMIENGAIIGLAVGFESAGEFNLGGSVVQNTISPTTDARVTGSSTKLTAGGNAKVSAEENDLVVTAGAGVVSASTLSQGSKAFGAAVATNVVKSNVNAIVDEADIEATSGSITVEGKRRNPDVIAVAFGGENAQSFALGGSLSTNEITHNIDSHVSNFSELEAEGDITIAATETTPTIVAATGNYDGASQGSAIGASISTNAINRDMRAYVGSKNQDEFDADYATAQQDNNIDNARPDGTGVYSADGTTSIQAARTNSLVLAVGVGGEGAEEFSFGGSAATNDIQSSTVDAHVWGASVSGGAGVSIDAKDVNATNATGAGNLDLSFLVQSSGGSDATSFVEGLEFLGTEDTIPDFEEVGSENVDEQQGIHDEWLEKAQNLDGSELAENEVPSIEELQSRLDALINGGVESTAPLTSALSSQSGPVNSNAPNASGLTAASVGIALANNLSEDSTVKAFAADSLLFSEAGSVDINAEQKALFVTVGGSGTVSGNGANLDTTEATTDYQPTTEAYIDASTDESRSEVIAYGNVTVDTDTKFNGVTIAGNAGFTESGTSVALTAATTKHTDKTKSHIDNADVTGWATRDVTSVVTGTGLELDTEDNFKGISVTATSDEVVTTVAAGVELSGKDPNLAASVSINLLGETTTADVHNGATLNNSNSEASEVQKINVFAHSDTTVQSGGGAIGLSGGGTFGTGLSADGGNVTKTTRATLEASEAYATDNISVQALSKEKLTSYEGTLEVSTGSDAIDIAAAASIYDLDLTTEAHIGTDDSDEKSLVVTDGNILVAADDVTRAHVFAGGIGVAVGGEASVGATLGHIHIHKDTDAKVYENASVIGKGDSTKDKIKAAIGGFDVTFEDPSADPTEVQPPGYETTDLVKDGSSPTEDQAYSQIRRTDPTQDEMQGVAITATSRDVVKGQSWAGGGLGSFNLDTSFLIRTGTTNTTATVDGDITSISDNVNDPNQNVLVTASHDYHQLALAGGVAIIGKASAVPVANLSFTELNTTAEIGDGATVKSSADTNVIAEGKEHLTIVSAGFAAGSEVSFDAQVAVDTLTNEVVARIGEGTTVDADGNVLVSAKDNTHATHVAGGAGISPPGALAAVGASFTYFDLDKTTTAIIEDSAIVDGRGNSNSTMTVSDGNLDGSHDFTHEEIHGVAVQAHTTEDVQNNAIAGSAGAYAGVGGGINYTHVHSDTTAEIGDSAQINQGTTGTPNIAQTVSVGATNDATIKNTTGGLLIDLGALGGAVDVGILRNNTTATIGEDAAVNAQADIDVHAVATRDVKSTVFNSEDGVLGIGAATSVWTIGKKLETTYETVPENSNFDSIALRSSGGSTPSYGSISEYADAQPNRTDATNGLGSYSTDSSNSDAANQLAMIGGNASDQLNMFIPDSKASDAIESDATGSTTAQVLGTTTVGNGVFAGGNIEVSSEERTDLKVNTGTIDVDAVSFGASVGIAHVRGGAVANSDAVMSAGGDISIEADSTSDLKNNAVFGSVTAASAGAGVAVIEDHSIQQASLGDGAEILKASSVNIEANRSFDEFETHAFDIEAGLGVAGASVAQSKVLGSTSAFAGNVGFSRGTSTPQVGAVSISANSDAAPKATAEATSLGVIVAGDGNRADAFVTPTVDAHFGSGGNATANLAGSMTIQARSTAEPYAEALGLGAAVVTVGVSLVSSIASPEVTAYVADNASVNLPNAQSNLTIKALSGLNANGDQVGDNPFAHGRASGGGVISGLGVNAKAHINPVVTAYVGKNTGITVSETLTVEAHEAWAGFAHASGGDYGGLAINQNNATLIVQPEVTAYVQSKNVSAEGVNINAKAGEPGSFSDFNFLASKVNFSNNTIEFEVPHGLTDGDTILYTPNAEPIGGLKSGAVYTVRVIDDRTVQFIVEINTSDIDSNSNNYVSSEKPHGLQTGDGFVYDADGNEEIGGLTDGESYFVNAVDPHTLRFAKTKEIAENLHQANFDVTQINKDSDWVQLEYLQTIGTSFVGTASKGNHRIDFPSNNIPTWADGTVVTYLAVGDDLIEDLVVQGEYWVRQKSGEPTEWHFYKTHDDYVNDKNQIKFHDNHQGRFVTFTNNDWYLASDGERCPDCNIEALQIDFENDRIVFSDGAAFNQFPPIETGDIVGIQPETGTDFGFGGPLNIYYYAYIDTSGGDFAMKLALTEADLNAHNFLEFVPPENFDITAKYFVTRPFQVKTGDPLNYNQPLDLRFTVDEIDKNGHIVIDTSDATELYLDLLELHQQGGKLTYSVASTNPDAEKLDQLNIGQEYGFKILDESSTQLTIQLNGIVLSSTEDTSGGAPTHHVLTLGNYHPVDGLVAGQDYYMIVGSNPGQVRFATSPENAANGAHVDLYPTPTLKKTGTSTTTDIVSVDYDANTITVADGSVVGGNGTEVNYHAAGNKWIIGLGGGVNYYITNKSGNTFQLATTASDATNGIARNLSKQARLYDSTNNFHGVDVDPETDILTFQSATTLETGDAVTYQGIFDQFLVGLEKGVTYYVVRVDPDDPTQIRLATSKERALSSDGRNDTIVFYEAPGTYETSNAGTQFIGLNGTNVTAPSTESTQYLIVDLFDSGATGEHAFTQTLGDPDSTPPPTPKVQASASNGSLLGVSGASANATIKPTVQAFVGSPEGVDTSSEIIILAEDIAIQSQSNVDIKAHAFDYTVGVIAGVGAADTNVDILNTTQSYVGANVPIVASRDILISANSSETVDAQTSVKGGGLVDDEHSKSDVTIGRETSVSIGNGAAIDAAGKNTLTATSTTSGTSVSKAHANGGVTLPSPKTNVKIGTEQNRSAVTQVNIGANSILNGAELDIDVSTQYPTFTAHTSAHSHGVYDNDSATANFLLNDSSELNIGSNVKTEIDTASNADLLFDITKLAATSEVHTRSFASTSHAQADLTLDGGVTRNGSFDDQGAASSNYSQILVPDPDQKNKDILVEDHKVVSHWLWLFNHKHEGGCATNNTQVSVNP